MGDSSFDNRRTIKKNAINPAWFAKDAEIVQAAQSALPLAHKKASELLIVWQRGSAQEPKDLGFGVVLYEMVLPGGYTSVRIMFATYAEVVIALRMRQSARNAPHVLRQLGEMWGDTAQCTDERISYEFRDAENYARMQAAIAQELGTGEEDEVPAPCQEAYAVLMDPLERYDYGQFCYMAGIPPLGRRAIEQLRAQHATGLISAVLRSPNPEARVYAVEALLGLARADEPISEADREAIRKIIALDIPISVCKGCFVSRSSARDIFAHYAE